MREKIRQTFDFAERVAAAPALEANARAAASGLYHATSAALMCWEASRPGVDARRALLARLILEHRLIRAGSARTGERSIGKVKRPELIFAERKVSLPEVAGLLGS